MFKNLLHIEWRLNVGFFTLIASPLINFRLIVARNNSIAAFFVSRFYFHSASASINLNLCATATSRLIVILFSIEAIKLQSSCFSSWVLLSHRIVNFTSRPTRRMPQSETNLNHSLPFHRKRREIKSSGIEPIFLIV